MNCKYDIGDLVWNLLDNRLHRIINIYINSNKEFILIDQNDMLLNQEYLITTDINKKLDKIYVNKLFIEEFLKGNFCIVVNCLSHLEILNNLFKINNIGYYNKHVSKYKYFVYRKFTDSIVNDGKKYNIDNTIFFSKLVMNDNSMVLFVDNYDIDKKEKNMNEIILKYKDYQFSNGKKFIYFKTIFDVLYANDMKLCNIFCKDYFKEFTYINQGINRYEFFKIKSIQENIDKFIKYNLIEKKPFEPVIIEWSSKGICIRLESEEELNHFKKIIKQYNFTKE